MMFGGASSSGCSRKTAGVAVACIVVAVSQPWQLQSSVSDAFLAPSSQQTRANLASDALVGAIAPQPAAKYEQQPRSSTGFASVAAVAASVAAVLAVGSSLRQRSNNPAFGNRTVAQPRVVAVSRKALNTGIVGLPNVGKSTLFNALCDKGVAEAANYPFCTIDPNTGAAKVTDKRLEKLAELASSKKIIPEFIEYVDIAGLVKGASKGEGLGNKFLGNIRSVNNIVHVVRCFDDDDIIHVSDSVDPERDIETITFELIFADMDQIEKRLAKSEKDIRNKKDGAQEEKNALDKILPALVAGKQARSVELTDEDKEAVRPLMLLTMKPVIFAANVAEEDLAEGNAYVEVVRKLAAETGDKAVIVSAACEAELSTLEGEDKAEYLESLGVEESGCETLVQETYKLLGLKTYFTVGPQEAHAWTIKDGDLAPQAAGVIHTDFEKGFIKAETIAYEDYVEHKTEEAAKAAGKVRIEGKNYEVQEADVLHFMFQGK